MAEYRNLQEQTRREVAAARDFALQKFARDLLDSVDNLDRALGNVPQEKLTEENKDLRDLHSGLTMTDEILMKTLKKHGMERIDPSVEGEPFNPNLHEATFQAPQPDKKDGTVFYTQQKGYLYNGRVLRVSMKEQKMPEKHANNSKGRQSGRSQKLIEPRLSISGFLESQWRCCV